MATSKLSKLLTLLEGSSGTLSISDLARDMELSRERVENMMEYWVRKGRIKSVTGPSECGACSSAGDCAFFFEMPRGYELAGEGGQQSIILVHPACKPQMGN